MSGPLSDRRPTDRRTRPRYTASIHGLDTQCPPTSHPSCRTESRIARSKSRCAAFTREESLESSPRSTCCGPPSKAGDLRLPRQQGEATNPRAASAAASTLRTRSTNASKPRRTKRAGRRASRTTGAPRSAATRSTWSYGRQWEASSRQQFVGRTERTPKTCLGTRATRRQKEWPTTKVFKKRSRRCGCFVPVEPREAM